MSDAFVFGRSAPVSQQWPSRQVALGLATVRWLAELPEKVRPTQTATRYPHIANALNSRWLTPVACRAYFEELLLDDRVDRQGFPPAVARELVMLQDYYDSVVFPTNQTAWGQMASRKIG
jgi:hypothetical protein